MKQYQESLQFIKENGSKSDDRTGTGTTKYFSPPEMRFDLSQGFPIVTTKYVPFHLIVSELIWIIKGDTNIKFLEKYNNHIWDEWADDNGDLGAVYGEMWRKFPGVEINETVDQIDEVIRSIKVNPNSRRLIVSAWHPALLPIENVEPKENPKLGRQALATCHSFFQFFVNEGRLSCKLTQRSADYFLGVPFNISSYSLLTHMIAQVCDLEVGEFIWSGGDCHVYNDHEKQVEELLKREPLSLPTLMMDASIRDIDDFTVESFELDNYNYHPKIKAEVSV